MIGLIVCSFLFLFVRFIFLDREKADLRKAAIHIHLRFDPLFFICGQNYSKLHRRNISVKSKKCHKLHRRLYFLVKINSSPCWIEAALPFEGFMFFVFDILWLFPSTFTFALVFCLWLVFCSCLLFLSFVLVFCSCLLSFVLSYLVSILLG